MLRRVGMISGLLLVGAVTAVFLASELRLRQVFAVPDHPIHSIPVPPHGVLISIEVSVVPVATATMPAGWCISTPARSDWPLGAT